MAPEGLRYKRQMSVNETKPASQDQQDERRPEQPQPVPPKVRNDGTATEGDDGHETGGGHDGMDKGPTGS